MPARSDRKPRAAALALGLMLAAAPALAQESAATVEMPLDQPTTIDGIEAACTGIGQTREDPAWKSYGVRIEFSNAKNEYLGAGAIRLKDRAGKVLLDASCDAPWILLRLPPGAYSVEGWLPGASLPARSAPISPPKEGQTRFVLQFPDAP
ncbi:hypothetical protein [Phenylobacterium sp.]|uniref:hypothetical protein n=1 Tax=Phenylobacterium sp. TaxID=1871053 RepID=UPI0035AD9420